MKLTLEERIAHGAHKVLRWMMYNVYVREVYMMAGEFMFFKKENLSGRWRGLNDHGFVYVSE